MAGLNIDLNKAISVGRKSRGKMPTKKSINLVIKKESILSTQKGRTGVLLGTLIILVLIAVLIVRPIFGLAGQRARVQQLTSELDNANLQIAEMSDIEDEYAHYTYEGMTAEELGRVDRAQVMKLVQDKLISGGAAKKWTLSENIMVLEVTGTSLADLNQIAGELEEEPIVERCVINTANKGQNQNDSAVKVSFVIYLQQSEEAEAEADAAASETAETANAAEGGDE